MTAGGLSVIVVSRHRPAALARCVTGLRQQLGVALEVVVVADSAGIAAVQADDLKLVTFDEANISAARNLGLAQAAGEIIAFIDDDAVAEPTWAWRLLAAFEDAGTVAATGYVRGRNGISLQWRCSSVDALGLDHEVALPDEGVHYPDPGPGRAIKTQGTNCAFRASVLRGIGGFDPNYRFYFDETDVNLRLLGAGKTAVIPLAQVHHGYLESERRRADRVPLSLHEIGASTAVFLRRHAAEEIEAGRLRLIEEQGRRLDGYLAGRKIDRAEAERLMGTLALGWQDGLARPMSRLAPLQGSAPSWRELKKTATGGGVLLIGWRWSLPRLRAEAERQVKAGKIVTVLCLSAGVRRHWQEFSAAGYWLQKGGIWGLSDRKAPISVGKRYSKRLAELSSEFRRFRPVN
ncbi:glycosyltransferase family 2 protein [Thioclava sp. FR2]|uniref:glycosyltransferase family 2 protein n=1 Tax=Thioclava sp. FR2 TaxID=3445780 RepID=UPI003EBDA87C